ncbi:hypothetical protein CANARDRAFT_28783 [[Candida] arabinofermentans NRRL YB-2248]|uniref:DNA polymerase n=1 Tax=[Candida] arabinofermentans NRRL YB-2248 TaxID=983967 RepID=A0A1E4T000_9ASCO|nr:hypothetical protein CANARDRAFT_28783 [[Candida] arabinofermentans NRRL YB-2248]
MGRSDKLARLRAARAGTKLASDDEMDNSVDIYEEVDELEYRKHKRDQLLNDDFIVDENGEGYAETGADEWDSNNRQSYSGGEDDDNESNEEEETKKKKIRKVKKASVNVPVISDFFKQNTESIKPKQKLPTESLDDILNDFTASSSKVKSTPFFASSRKRDVFSTLKSEKTRSPMSRVKPLDFKNLMDDEDLRGSTKKAKLSSDNDYYSALDSNQNDDFGYSNDTYDAPSSPIKMVKKSDVESAPAGLVVSEKTDIVKQEAEASIDEEMESEDEDEVVVAKRPRSTAVVNRSVNMNSTKEAIKAIDSSPVKEQKVAFTSSPSRFSTTSFDRYEEDQVVSKNEDGSSAVQMFWLDYAEVENSLLLFGKIKTNEGKLVSGMVQVNGINRELYFLPREYRQVDEEEEEEDAKPEKVTTMDVHEEIAPLLMQKFGLPLIKTKPEVKKYAFELHGIPKEAEYLKVLIPYQTPQAKNITLPSDLEGETFSHVFGTNANIFESFVVQRNIMGPCWLEIKNGDFNALRNSSHCSVEIALSQANHITPINTNEPAPNLSVMSINVQSIMNVKEGKQEIGSVSLAIYKDLPQDAPVDENLRPHELVTLVRPVGGSITLPPGLTQLASKKNIAIRTFNNERTLLNCLAAMVKKSDPDVFIGHRLENISLDIIMHRMYDLKVNTWSTFGRRNRKQFPDKFGRGSGRNNVFYLREIFAGRLICDIANEMGQSLTTKCQSWDLPEMFEVVCKKKHIPMEVNLNNPQFADDANHLLAAFNENNISVQIIAEVSFRMQILSLSKQLTNLAGNAWSHTLGGTRAGRNEYILLHEFTRNGYVVPDKETRAQRQQAINIQQQEMTEGNEADESTAVTSNKKSKFQGGLVFEPEKGLHKNYILVMDFNSLYPSIIQEFNICFTTVDRASLTSEDELPIVPSTDVPQGVLPRLLHQLVTRRYEVKKLLKDPRASPIEKAQYDIKQQALKLTANSMYGCLGYVNSRFYARPLAMLVTNRGREILMDTRQLAESIGLSVVYGDTDSVMIDTGSDNFKDAIKIGEEFKIKVNERYRLLEIDIDNVFKKLLLHSKKKYAAMNVTMNSDGTESAVLEVKGLDMKRREYCPLSKEISTFVLEKVMGELEPEDALNEIYSYLSEVSAKLNNNEIPMVKLKINTKLSKDPKMYPNGKTMPSVQVALRLRDQGKVIKAGNVITFVITNEGIDDGLSVADRARAITEVLSKTSNYKVDSNYYLEKQIFAPVERLLEKIEGNDVVRLASSLGLDSKKYESRARQVQQQNSTTLQPLESTIPDSDRFRDSKPLKLTCPSCQHFFPFGGIQSSNNYQITHSGIRCLSCQFVLPPLSVSAQLESFLRTQISQYYAGWLHCDDCGITTRQVSVYGRRCIGISGKAYGCKGIMRYLYSDKALYNQLLYLQSCFDVDKAKKRALKPLYEEFSGDVSADDKENKPSVMSQGELDALVEQNRSLFEVYQGVVDNYLEDCGRRYVDMGGIFGFMSAFEKK